MKKTFAIVLACAMMLALLPATVLAADTIHAGTVEEFKTAIVNAAPGDTIQLTASITAVGETIEINKDLVIDLNGYDICVAGRGTNNLYVTAGALTITGVGRIYENESNRWKAAIVVSGADAVNIGRDVTLEGWGGLMILKSTPDKDTVINLEGTINAYSDMEGGAGAGLYINGSVQNLTTYPVFNIMSTAVINATTGAGIYAAGYAEWNIEAGSRITGVDSAIGIKAGTLNISGGTLRATGPANIPTSGFSNGINGSGCAIQIESNSVYAGNVVINITGGTITSVNAYALYEYIDSGNTETEVESVSISGGAFQSAVSLAGDILTSAQLDASDRVSVTGGTFSKVSTDVAANVDSTYVIIIPASVNFGTLQSGTGIQSQPFIVKAENVVLDDGGEIHVDVDSTFIMTSGDAQLHYVLYNGVPTEVGAGGRFATFTDNGTETGSVEVNTNAIDAAGSYMGTMMFTITYAS